MVLFLVLDVVEAIRNLVNYSYRQTMSYITGSSKRMLL